ncbi:MAG: formate/nitrite transporter family protein [bacterium]|nr:formate/nitrite transporter family protein [bacterium]
MQTDLVTYLAVAEKKVKQSPAQTFILSILAGVFIALAGALATTVSWQIDNISLAKLLAGLVFPVGLILVIMWKTELFTGNILLLVAYWQGKIKGKELWRNWLLVYLGNFIGALLIVNLLYYCWSGNENLLLSLAKIAENKINLSILKAFILGVLCNFLVTLAVWWGVTKTTFLEKLVLIFLPIFTFVVLGFEHSVADMFYLPWAKIIFDNTSWLSLSISLLFITLGNIVGGAITALILNSQQK